MATVLAMGLVLLNILSWLRDIRVKDEVPATGLILLNLLSWQRDIRVTRMKSWQWDLYFLIYYHRNKVLSNVEWCLKRLIQWQLTFSHYNNDINYLHNAFSSHKIHNHLTEWQDLQNHIFFFGNLLIPTQEKWYHKRQCSQTIDSSILKCLLQQLHSHTFISLFLLMTSSTNSHASLVK